jgi:hypothetical protein
MVMDIESERLVLHPLALALALDEAKRVYDHAPSADDRWASEYPFEDELDALARSSRSDSAPSRAPAVKVSPRAPLRR